MDNLTKEQRGRQMSLVRSKDTRPEMTVRRLVFSLGCRYRLHGAGLPGKPDLVFLGGKKIIFVHGCFWHWHENCVLARLPKSRLDFWQNKLEGNRLRDQRHLRALDALGWTVLVVWECELRDLNRLRRAIMKFLENEESTE